MTKWLKIALGLLIGLVVLLWVIPVERNVKSNMFCAYGKLFVEFDDGFNVWGAMMLDDDGSPIKCNSGIQQNTMKLKDTI